MVFTSGPKVFVADWQSTELKDKNFQLVDICSYSHQNGADPQAQVIVMRLGIILTSVLPRMNDRGTGNGWYPHNKRSARTATKEENEDTVEMSSDDEDFAENHHRYNKHQESPSSLLISYE